MRWIALVFVAVGLAGCATISAPDNGPIAARAQAFIDEQRAIDQRECAARHGSAGVAYQACMQAKSIDRRVMLEEMLEQLEGRRTALAKQCHDPFTAAPAVCYDI